MEEFINQHDSNGLKHGPWTYLDVDGSEWCEVNYRHGQFHGLYKEVLELKTKEWIEVGYFDNGEKVGHWKRINKHRITEEIFIR